MQKRQSELQLRQPNLLGRLSQLNAEHCMSNAPSSLQDCVLEHALVVMQSLGPPHAQPVASKPPAVQGDAEQPFLAMHPICICTT